MDAHLPLEFQNLAKPPRLDALNIDGATGVLARRSGDSRSSMLTLAVNGDAGCAARTR